MANTYTWKIKQLECAPLFMGNENVVAKIYWACEGVSDQVKKEINSFGYEFDVITKSEFEGVVELQFTDKNFIPFENLTEAQVVEWVKLNLGANGVAEVQTIIDKDIEEKVKPSAVKLDPPWK